MTLYHFFGRDRGYDIISSKKDMSNVWYMFILNPV
jgi:hypothetical protein